MVAALQPTSTARLDRTRLESLLRSTPLVPLPGLLTPREQEHLLSTRVRQWEDNPEVHIVSTSGAMAAWKHLPWDSAHFGFSAARLEFAAAEDDGSHSRLDRLNACLALLLDDCRQEAMRHLTARADTGDLALIHSLEHHGFQLLDGIQTFALRFDGSTAAPNANVTATWEAGCRIGLFEPWQLDGVVDLAGQAYRFDRFHADSALTRETANQLHRDWLRNSCLGKAADAVFVASRSSEVLSYVTVSFDKELERCSGRKLAVIVLVATSESARGQGLAKRTTRQTLDWLQAQGAHAVTVGTQLRNVAAGRLYESAGFRLAATSLTFRKLLAADR